jgi:ubiquinone/menaquinone biosynthesis C-methylase UbiE
MELSAIPGWHVVALDRSAVCVSTAEDRLRRHGSVQQRQQSSFWKGSLHETALESASVDVVVAYNVLDQVEDLRAALKEVRWHPLRDTPCNSIHADVLRSFMRCTA